MKLLLLVLILGVGYGAYTYISEHWNGRKAEKQHHEELKAKYPNDEIIAD